MYEPMRDFSLLPLIELPCPSLRKNSKLFLSLNTTAANLSRLFLINDHSAWN